MHNYPLLQSGFGIFKYRHAVNIPALAMIDDVLGMATCGDDSIEMNAVINAKMESKKLRLSEDKCFKIHICRTGKMCTQQLKVHNNDMKSVSQATYLGDIISENGTIDETIEQRGQKATGIISQIASILSSISLGSFHFDISLVMRNAKFVNSILVNSEVWHNVQMRHIESLEKSDLELLRKILNAHSKTAKEAFFLELGIFPLRYHVAMRRFMYLWHVLHRDPDEVINKVYVIQKCNIIKGDWAKIVQEEKIKYAIMETDETIAKLSKHKFKKLVKNKLRTHAIQCLRDMAQPHSKSTGIKNNPFKKQPYFSDRRFSKDDVQLLFALRTRMVECKSNFSEQYQRQLHCRLCKVPHSIENEDHLLNCSVLNTEKYEIQFSDVFGNTDQQYQAVKVFKKVLRRWRVYIDVT